MIEVFRRLYGSAQGLRVFRAPGRVNVIGEHTDYNLGFVMPVALDLAAYIATAPATADGPALRICSEHAQEMREFDHATLKSARRQGHWTDYPIGVYQQLANAGIEIAPANLLIRSTVPEGSGLSSSAALEVASALAFLNGRAMDGLEIARLCQRAEREFVGVPVGIMDQYVSVFGREHRAVEIDCRSLERRYVELPAGAALVAVNSQVKHALAGSAYKERVAECAAAVEAIRRRFPSVASLRDVTPEQLEFAATLLPPLVLRRARHVVSENRRVQLFREAGSRGELSAMGELLVKSHRSLQHDYEVSCPELDFLVDTALAIEGVYGSRMTGGGFGGCTVTLLNPEAIPDFQLEVSTAYDQRFHVVPQIYRCVPSNGAGEEKNFERIPAAG
jgi:galactokinase